MLIVLQVFLSVNVLFCVEIPFAAAQDTCYSNRGCSSDKVCCICRLAFFNVVILSVSILPQNIAQKRRVCPVATDPGLGLSQERGTNQGNMVNVAKVALE